MWMTPRVVQRTCGAPKYRKTVSNLKLLKRYLYAIIIYITDAHCHIDMNVDFEVLIYHFI